MKFRQLSCLIIVILLNLVIVGYGVGSTIEKIRNTPKAIKYIDIGEIVSINNFFDTNFNPSGDYQNDFIDNGNGTITDKKSGLMWEIQGSDKEIGYKKARKYIEELNTNKIANYNNWRFPTIDELYTLLSNEKHEGYYCHPILRCNNSIFWSADRGVFSPSTFDTVPMMVSMNFDKGTVGLLLITSTQGRFANLQGVEVSTKGIIRAVRNIENLNIDTYQDTILILRSMPMSKIKWSQIKTIVKNYNFYDSKLNSQGIFPNRYVDNYDQVITDQSTGLMWEKNGSLEKTIYDHAERYIKSLNQNTFAGYNNWRMPTIEELYSLLEPKEHFGQHIDPIFNIKGATYWSADGSDLPQADPVSWAKNLIIDFNSGTIGEAYKLNRIVLGGANMITFSYIRAVRTIK